MSAVKMKDSEVVATDTSESLGEVADEMPGAADGVGTDMVVDQGVTHVGGRAGDVVRDDEMDVQDHVSVAVDPVERELAEVSADDMVLKLRLLEATIFASGEPVSTEMLKRQLGGNVNVLTLLETVKENYVGRGVNLVESNGNWSFRTAPDIAPFMKITRQPRRKLPRAASEVLAIIAYHQPVTRADIESIRGVDTSKGTLDILLELGWVRPGKRRDTPGRPLTWHTTDDFLSHFNLETLRDLPGLEELKAAGLLDARPVMARLPREDDDASDVDAPDEDTEYALWEPDDVDAEADKAAAG